MRRSGVEIEKFCQSCGKRLTNTNQGTNFDGGKSHLYCSRCFERGKYIDSGMSFESMLNMRKKEIKQNGYNGFKVVLTILSYRWFLKEKARWRTF